MDRIFGTKVGMSRFYKEDGTCVPATYIKVDPIIVTQIKSVENDGYSAIQVGLGSQKSQRVNKAMKGHLAKTSKGFARTLKEIRCDETELTKYELGTEIKATDVFTDGQKIDVIGISKGKGFAGVMKRHNMAGFKATHGTHEYFRHGGSIGCRKFPGRVFKNKRMPGHMGVDRVTQLGLVVLKAQDDLLVVKGAVPGNNGEIVEVRKTVR